MVSEAQKRASEAYRKRHHEQTIYTTLRRNAFNFVNGYKKGGKTQQAIDSEYGANHYSDDLNDLLVDLKKALEALK